MKVVFALALIALCAGAAFAKCGNDKTSKDATEKGNVGPCTWYEDKQCCNFTAATEKAFEKRYDGGDCAAPTDGCKEMSMLFSCGLSCSPDQSDWTKKDGTNGNKITVCKAFADRLYGACGDAEYNKNTKTTKADCVKIKDEYKDGTEYIEALKMDVADDNKDCFNSASSLVASVAVIATALFALF
jgi:Folate receptor family